jgi:nicotinamide riboside kinase
MATATKTRRTGTAPKFSQTIDGMRFDITLFFGTNNQWWRRDDCESQKWSSRQLSENRVVAIRISHAALREKSSTERPTRSETTAFLSARSGGEAPAVGRI